MNYDSYVIASESPNGEDNRMGSGAFSRYQFMPATAAELARRTAWGATATPENVKSLVLAAPGRDKELFGLYNANSQGALKSAGLPATNPNMMALHRFGQGGGTSLLKAPGTMSVADWVRSVNWGPGIAASEVIRQNKLDRFRDVDALRRGFLGGGFASAFEGAEPPQPEPTPPLFVDPAPSGPRSGRGPEEATNMLVAQQLLADAFIPRPEDRKRKKSRPLFV